LFALCVHCRSNNQFDDEDKFGLYKARLKRDDLLVLEGNGFKAKPYVRLPGGLRVKLPSLFKRVRARVLFDSLAVAEDGSVRLKLHGVDLKATGLSDVFSFTVGGAYSEAIPPYHRREKLPCVGANPSTGWFRNSNARIREQRGNINSSLPLLAVFLRSFACPQVLEIPDQGALSRQRSRVRVSSSPPFFSSI